MYKYTYLLSQSYRTETSDRPQNYQSNKQPNPTNPSKFDIPHKQFNYQTHSAFIEPLRKSNESKNVEKIGMKYYESPGDGWKYRSNQVGHKIPNEKALLRDDNADTRIKQISAKYAHRSIPKESRETISKNPVSQDYSAYNTENRNYHQYKQKKIIKVDAHSKPDYQSRVFQQQVRPTYERLRSQSLIELQYKKHPLQQPNRIVNARDEPENDVNRKKVKTEIANFIQNAKMSKQQYPYSSNAKKYNYPIENAAIQQPPERRNEPQQCATVAKLSSLQQRIKSTIGTYLPV